MDNSLPGLERAIRVLRHLSQRPDGVGAAELGAAADIPRATLYRILRVLRAENLVAAVDGDESRLALGPGLLALARTAQRPADLVQKVRPVMDALSQEIGETVKFVARSGREVTTLAVAQSAHDSRIAARVGTKVALHVGASQRLLLAFAPEALQVEVLGGPLERVASRTVTSAAVLRKSLPGLRLDGHASGHSEGVEGVGAFAAAVRDPFGDVTTAIAAVYVHAGKTAEQRRRIALATTRAAARATGALLP